MSSGPEYTLVEQPFIDQLVRMGWSFTTGELDHPSATGRESFRDVLLKGDLENALRRINLNEAGQPWLDAGRIAQAVGALSRLTVAKLLEANQAATELIIKGTVVDGVEGWDGGRGRTVQFIDWYTIENNTFRAINQFKLECPVGQADKHIVPDVVLFVNGIPLCVVEAKSPTVAAPLEEAVDQLQRYANRRRALGVVDVNEGNEQLFHYAQLLVATCGEQARMGTLSSQAVHFLAWKDTSPIPEAQVAASLDKAGARLSEQEKLVAGALHPAHLLDIVRHFTLFMESGGGRVKVVCRYQQFRAVQLAVQRLLTGKTRAQDGELDRRGGIIWHTQGSGKSLTMVFLIRKMRTDLRLRRFKVVVVTDRRNLEGQLSETAALTGEVLTLVKAEPRGVRTASANEVLQEVLRRPGRDLVFAMIQKYRGELVPTNAPPGDDDDDEVEPQTPCTDPKKAPSKSTPMPVLNASEEILVLVDEAHRSHTNTAHANLMRALPNCVKIGFTGTPIIMREKGQTEKIFGDFIDRYTILQSEADGATVPILYEGRTAPAAVEGGGDLDEVFEDMLIDRTPEELEAIRKKYGTKEHVMEATKLVQAKARNMLRHYVENILPNGFKAQVVAYSRRAAVRYVEALVCARDELVAEIEGLHPCLHNLTSSAIDKLDRNKAFLVRARRFLPTLRAIEFAAVISGEHNDKVDPGRIWSTQATSDARIQRFKKALFATGPNTFDHERADPLAFLIVKSMLLTGFDAPIEQVMYLDRPVQEAELLQAMARVNRTYSSGPVEKGFGIVVDYYGVAEHLKDALKAYAKEDVSGAIQSLKDELPKLRDRHRRALDVFEARGLHVETDADECVELLRDERLRADFHVKLKQLLTTLDLVLPRPEGLPFVNDAKLLAHIQARARNRYRASERLIGSEVGEKVRKLIDEHIISLGIDPSIPPIEITADDFAEQVERHRSPRARASEMEHALRHHIRKHLDEDPSHYATLSARLESILREFDDRWAQLSEALKALVEQAKAGRAREDDTAGLDPATQAPFFDVLKSELAVGGPLAPELRERLCALTVEIVEHTQQEIRLVGFWTKTQAREALRSWMFMALDDANLLPFGRLDLVADKLLELAKANHERLIR